MGIRERLATLPRRRVCVCCFGSCGRVSARLWPPHLVRLLSHLNALYTRLIHYSEWGYTFRMLPAPQGMTLRIFLYSITNPSLACPHRFPLVRAGLYWLGIHHTYGFHVFLRVYGQYLPSHTAFSLNLPLYLPLSLFAFSLYSDSF
jgi:hypothetical protein